MADFGFLCNASFHLILSNALSGQLYRQIMAGGFLSL